MSVFTNPATASPEETRAYVTALVELLGEREPLHVLMRTPGELRHLLLGVPESQLTEPEAPGKWSIRHVIQHLADSELVWGVRLRRVLAEDRPALVGYDQDLWADRLGYDETDADEALADFAALRKMNLRQLRRAGPEALGRVGVHAERGEESLEHMLRLYAGHDLLHLRQLERIETRLRGPDR